MSKTQPARGMRDFLPADIRKREYVIGIIKSVYESYGFEPLETPAVENLETLMGKYGEEGNQLVFKILKRGEKLDVNSGELSDLALRYDLTVPLARVVANYKNDLPKFFKRYQIQPVWRADRPARGRFREFYQCDVDAIGSGSMLVEVDIISAVCEILQKLGFENFKFKINHRKLLTGLLDEVKIDVEKQADALVAIDKLDKILEDGVYKELLAKGIEEEAADRLIGLFSDIQDLISRSKDYDQANKGNLSALEKSFPENVPLQFAITELRKVLNQSKNSHLLFDPSLARGLSYYTGTIMEINVPDLAGSLGGGGRYDGLIGMFGKEQIPACGFSLGLERILVVMEERKMFPPEIAAANSADVMVLIQEDADEENVSEAMSLSNYLREQDENLKVLLYPQADKIKKQFNYALSINVPFVVFISEQNKADGTVTLANMRSNERQIVKREEVAKKIKSA
jgi:histidyl-tRNA synthetase